MRGERNVQILDYSDDCTTVIVIKSAELYTLKERVKIGELYHNTAAKERDADRQRSITFEVFQGPGLVIFPSLPT